MSVLRQVMGGLPLCIFVASWVAMGELIQGLLTNWQKPWLLTYCIKSGFSLALLPYLALRRVRQARAPCEPLPVPERTLLTAAALLSPISTACTVTWYLSLPGTSFAGNSAVYQSATAFALLFSLLLLGEAVTRRKVACVGGALAGVALVAAGGSAAGGRDTVAGYAWVLTSTALYALYEVLYARLTRAAPPAGAEGQAREGSGLAGEEGGSGALAAATAPLLRSPAAAAAAAPAAAPAWQPLLKAETAALVLGGIGVATLLTQWPLFFVAHAAGWERFDWPPPPAKARLVALNVGLDSVYNFSLLWGISTSSAFAMQLASTLVVPVGILADWVLHGALPSALAALGACLVLISVLALEAPLEGGPAAACQRVQAALCPGAGAAAVATEVK
jgi:drug/metabolite transporter (DMT)-like permease